MQKFSSLILCCWCCCCNAVMTFGTYDHAWSSSVLTPLIWSRRQRSHLSRHPVPARLIMFYGRKAPALLWHLALLVVVELSTTSILTSAAVLELFFRGRRSSRLQTRRHRERFCFKILPTAQYLSTAPPPGCGSINSTPSRTSARRWSQRRRQWRHDRGQRDAGHDKPRRRRWCRFSLRIDVPEVP